MASRPTRGAAVHAGAASDRGLPPTGLGSRGRTQGGLRRGRRRRANGYSGRIRSVPRMALSFFWYRRRSTSWARHWSRQMRQAAQSNLRLME